MNERRSAVRRMLRIGALLIGVVLAGAGGWVAAVHFQSPAQREAAASAPSPGPITVPVVSDALEETASARGTVVQATAESIRLTSEGKTVVTEAPMTAGATVSGGSVLSELNGRPVIALAGQFPYYRDLRPGDDGPDVSQLQAALGAAGYPLHVDGTFGPATERAVRALYRAIGYSAPTETVAAESESAGEPQVSSGASDEQVTGDSEAAPAAGGTQAQRTVERLAVRVRELSAISVLPATVTALPAIGTVVDADTAVNLSSGELVATISVAASLLARLSDQAVVTISSDDGQALPAAIVQLPTISGDQTEGAVVVRPNQPFEQAWLGADVLAVFTLRGVQGESLVVPSQAVVSAGADTASVLRQEDDGSFRSIPVTELGMLGGRSAVKPLDSTALAVGDLVRVD